MKSFVAMLRRNFLGISEDEVTFARRQFPGALSGARQHLEHVARTFIRGYHAAFEKDAPDDLEASLDAVDEEFRGFAYEGAAMALGLLDRLTPWRRNRVDSFLRGSGGPHIYMVHAGVGMALARLRRRANGPPAGMDPLLGWLVLDGYGFHEGFFHWKRSCEQLAIPPHVNGYAGRAFDQGLGRSLWFIEGAQVERMAPRILRFPESRHADLWSGVGLACAYAGGIDRSEIETLSDAAGPDQAHFAQGAAFAAQARRLAGIPTPHTELTCNVCCGMTAEDTAEMTCSEREALPIDGPVPAYEVWRQRIRERCSLTVGATCP